MHVDRTSRLLPVAGFVAAVVCCLSSPVAGQTTPAATPAVRERVLAPAVRDMRIDVVRPPDRTGRVLLDTRKIAANATVAAGSVLANDLAGNPISVDTLGGTTVAVNARDDQWVVVRPAAVSTQVMQRGVQWLPGLCLAPAPTPGGAKTVFSSYADFATVPVVWDVDAGAYRVEGAVGVARDGDLAQGGAIGRVATVKMHFVGVSGAAGSEFEISELGIAGERPFSSRFAGTDVAKPVLVVKSSLGGEQPYVLEVRPRVALTPRRNPILGLGLESVGVVVECVEAHGAPLALAGPSAITVQCSSGHDDGADGLSLTGAEPRAEFRFRSAWLGPARIVATTRLPSGAVVGSLVIQQTMPWPQVMAAVAGGALGGFARRFVRGARRRTNARRIGEGVVVGLVAFVAGVLGVGFLALPAVIVATTAGAFLTGVLAGFAGVVVLERLSKAQASDRS